MSFQGLIYQTLVKNRKKQSILFLLLSVVLGLLQAPIPYLTGYMIDEVLPVEDGQKLLEITLILGGLYAGYLCFSYLNSKFELHVRRSIMVELNYKAIRGILRMSYNERLQHHNGDLVSRLTRDTVQLHQIMPYGWSRAFHQALLAIILLTVVFILNWQLSAMLLSILPVAVLIYMKFNDALWASADEETKASAEKLASIQETIEADSEVKAYEAEKFFLQHSGRSIQKFEDKSFIRELYDLKVSSIILGMPMLASVLIWYFGGHKIMQGEISVGLIITYTATLAMIVPALVNIVEFASSLPNELTALERITHLFRETEADEHAAPEPHQKPDSTKTVETLSVQNLSFSYNHRYPLFKDLNIVFCRGSAYLVNGGNGAGKSTLLTILSGSLTPLDGATLINDKSLKALEKKSSWITYVPQRIHIISDSVSNNVTLGQAISRQSVIDALHTVGLGNWINQLEDGIDHHIRNANTELSGGQIQKLGIARALVRDTPILLMDEPTNNLDSQAVKALIDTIKKHKQDRIIIIVSHDDRVFDAVDKVVYLENNNTEQSTQVVVK